LALARVVKIGPIVGPQDNGLAVDHAGSIGSAAINDLMLDILAAVARKDYEDRRRRVAQGQAKAKGEGKFRGRKENVDKNRAIARALKKGSSWSDIQALTGCSRATVARVAAKQRPA
jgi:DNA invertase Pin-like site-specific DNA recombinase